KLPQCLDPFDVLQMEEEDVLKFLVSGTDLDGTNLDFRMEQYSNKRKSDSIYIINLEENLEKLLMWQLQPLTDHQPLTEASCVNLLTIALCNTDSLLCCVDISIPCNNKGAHSVGLMWWSLAQEVLHMCGPEEIEKEGQAAAEKAVTEEEFE
ncbi:ribosomal protein sa-like, partial [Lynx pardinus]